MKNKNIILLIMLLTLVVLLCGCSTINKAHNETKRNALHVFKTEDDIDKVNGSDRYKYDYKVNKSGKVIVSVEIYEKGKLIKEESIEKNISVENNDEVVENVDLSVLTDEQSNIIWELHHGEKSEIFTTENYIDRCTQRLINIASDGYADDGKTISLLEYKGNYNDKMNFKNEGNNEGQQKVGNREQILDSYDFVLFFQINYEALN